MISGVGAGKPSRLGRLRHPARRAGRLTVALVAVWALAIGVLIAFGTVVAHSAVITSWDASVTRYVVAHRTAGLTAVMKALTWAGSWIAAFALVVLIVVLAWRRRMSPAAVITVSTLWLGELAAVTLAKSVVRRPRPPEEVRLVTAHGWSFPSGHTANAVVVFVTLALVVTVLVSRSWLQVLTWIGAVLALGLVGFSRIELGVHWASDVIASWIWCTGWILLVERIFRRGNAHDDTGPGG